ncbi:hypothetical protein EV356DRAFT_565514 [Viridothelium virens]|uniref:Yeast cell wall synthesis Kre9/Knh1-like N-terminal domain-containing protein n=1 Tax=Viridothelium virens TaxID=1048519 RepID=A0A6A6HE36_VIRVR|nr:hypothetical protein EV356DRAFT_565514 [Viridothelium virens]
MSQDFSAFALFTAGLAAFVSVASAQQSLPYPPTTQVGNPTISPAQNETVAIGAPYSIKWNSDQKPTGCDKVSLRLLSGCPKNCVQEGDLIAKSIDNNGFVSWNVPASIAPDAPNQYTHGIQIVCDHSGDYQYSPNFGLGKSSSPVPPVGTTTLTPSTNTTSSSLSSASTSISTSQTTATSAVIASTTLVRLAGSACVPSGSSSSCTSWTSTSASLAQVTAPANGSSSGPASGRPVQGSASSAPSLALNATTSATGGTASSPFGSSTSAPLSNPTNAAGRVTGAGAGMVILGAVAAMML